MQKADLVDDAWALAFASTISMKIPLRITPFAVVNETDSVFWTSVLSVLRDRINIYGTDSPIQVTAGIIYVFKFTPTKKNYVPKL